MSDFLETVFEVLVECFLVATIFLIFSIPAILVFDSIQSKNIAKEEQTQNITRED